MAWYIDKTKVKQSTETQLAHWNAVHTPGSTVGDSGIYYCTGCGKERACNEGDPFPPQNHHQHSKDQGDIRWKLRVRAET